MDFLDLLEGKMKKKYIVAMGVSPRLAELVQDVLKSDVSMDEKELEKLMESDLTTALCLGCPRLTRKFGTMFLWITETKMSRFRIISRH